jgi:hypothetical protein
MHPSASDIVSSVFGVIALFFLKIILFIIGFLALIALIVFLLFHFRIIRPYTPYKALSALLTPAEKKFYFVLKVIAGDKFHVFSKVRVADLLTPTSHVNVSFKEFHRLFAAISQKHVVNGNLNLTPFRGLSAIEF